MLLIIYFLLLVIVLGLLQHLYSKPIGSPPGTVGWPLIGSLPFSKISMTDMLLKCQKKYGDIFWIKLGLTPTVFLCEYEDIKEAFNNPSLMAKPKFKMHIQPYIGKGIFTSNDDVWKDARIFTFRHLRNAGMDRVTAMESIIAFEADYLVEDFSKHLNHPTELPWSINAAVFNVIWKLVGDKRYDINSKHINVVHTRLFDILNLFQGRGFFLNMMPQVFTFMPNVIKRIMFGEDKRNEYFKQIMDIMQEVIDEHRENLDVDNPKDLIDYYLIELQNSEKSMYPTFSEADLMALLIDLFFAGSVANATTIRWYILYMILNPQIQSKVHREIDRVVGKDRIPNFKDKTKMPYLEATLMEIMRLKTIHPIVPRQAVKDINFKGYTINKGTQVFAHLMGSHLDERHWERPREFYPEHFLHEDGTLNLNNKAFLPFSVGKRVCIGENLANMELYQFIASIMQNFSFSAAPGEKLRTDGDASQKLFVLPRPFKVIINKRIN